MIKLLKSNKGFSLVELMIVVAIIGILASVAIPNFQRFQRKARQSEARALLAGYYTSEKAFEAEYAMFGGNWAAIGYKPDGQMGYRVITTNSANATVTGLAYYVAACTVSSAVPTTCFPNTTASWAEKPAGSAAAPGPNTAIAAGAAPTATTFIGTASGFIGAAAADTWTVNEARNYVNTQSGL